MAIQKAQSPTSTSLRAKDLYRLRAMDMLRCRIKGMSRTQIAESYNCSIDTVERSLTYARREGLVQAYENQVIGDLVPKAIQVYMNKLDSTDGEEFFAAKDIMDKLFKMGDRFQTKETVKEEMGLKAYLAEKGKSGNFESDNGPKTVEGTVIDVNTTNDEAGDEGERMGAVAGQWDKAENAGDLTFGALPKTLPDEDYG